MIIKKFEEVGETVTLRNTPMSEDNSLYWYLKQLEERALCYSDKIDVPGILYHQFLHYSAGDGAMGIVLTPPHICEFMAEMIDVSPDDNLLDICCGTGGFLLAGPSAAGSGKLVGIEHDIYIYTMAVFNAVLRGQKRMKIYNGDSFASMPFNSLSDIPFTKALLNPPYSQKDHCELEFVQRVIERLEKGGKLAVICPISCAIGKKFKAQRKDLMEKHSLKAVLTMPDKLFDGNGATISTCIMVWEAHTPNHEETFLGSFKDDGFVNKRKRGMIDANNKWKGIKEEWLDLYRNKKEVPQKTVNRLLTDTDEWLCERYLTPDYHDLTSEDFKHTVSDYFSFLVKEGFYYEN